MTNQATILITGAASYWGARVAARLMAEPAVHVIGFDLAPPEEPAGLDFVEASLTNPALAELLAAEEVAAVCHLDFVDGAGEANVAGTAKLLQACAAAGVARVVLKSSTAVYGARPDNPAFLTEAAPLRGSRRYGPLRALLDIEALCHNFQQQSPGVSLTILRFASIAGPTADTPMTRFLNQPSPPVLLGFDPSLQLIHEDDVVEALAHAVLNDLLGPVNVAAEGALPLTRILTIARRVPLPLLHPLAYRAQKALRLPIDPDYLRYTWIADLARMREEMGFAPHYSAEAALRAFVGPAERAINFFDT
ncbi:MAG: NAD-dependent epimerase/dehydratase family protein [Chloroflexi bacterium]|nr:NAD-dependent epimerase/dehydratase family protein [Chloroflexota bacterium]